MLNLLARGEVLAGEGRLGLRSVQQVVVGLLGVGGICSIDNYLKGPCHNGRSVDKSKKSGSEFRNFGGQNW